MKNKLVIIFTIASWVFSAMILSIFLYAANIPFWYDPARDMLSAWANLHKITLIGPPSGIPGFFYGPYWIWWLSFGQLFSKNPAIVAGVTMSLPYLIFFFGILMAFGKMFGRFVSTLLWLLFFMSFQGYMTQLWNPYLAPVFFLAVIYLLIFHTGKMTGRKSVLSIFSAGILTGIALNIHISFSVGFTIGCILFLLIKYLYSPKQKQFVSQIFQSGVALMSFILGIGIAFVPFLLFEVRHGFHQTQTAIHAFLRGGDVVLQHGFSRPEILQQAVLKFSQLLRIPLSTGVVLLAIVIILYMLYFVKKRLTFQEKSLVLLLGLQVFGVLFVYLIAKNPIWDYHFYGFEVLWLLLIGLIASKSKLLQYILILWVATLAVMWVGNFITTLGVNPLTRGSLYTKEYIVQTIQKDAGKQEYTVYVYSPSIYTYEYNYLFRWMAGKEFSYDPGQIQQKGTVYLILPPAKQSELTNFVHFHTPDAKYTTSYVWHIPDGTTILKRNLLQ